MCFVCSRGKGALTTCNITTNLCCKEGLDVCFCFMDDSCSQPDITAIDSVRLFSHWLSNSPQFCETVSNIWWLISLEVVLTIYSSNRIVFNPHSYVLTCILTLQAYNTVVVCLFLRIQVYYLQQYGPLRKCCFTGVCRVQFICKYISERQL